MSDEEITRERATEIGAIEIVLRGLGTGAHPAVAFGEMEFRVPSVYGVDMESCWVVYARRKLIGLFSSNIVLIARRGGAILYAGSAHDEG